MAVTTAPGTTDVLVSGTTSPLTLNYSRAPIAGELLRIDVIVRRATTVPPTTTITGYTAGPTKTMSAGAGAEQARLSQYWRVADGTEGASVSVAYTGSSAQALLRDRVGLDTSSPHDVDGAGVTSNANAPTLTPSITPVAASTWIDTATAFSNAATGVTFGGGSTVDDGLAAANNVGLATGTQTVSSPGVAVNPTCAWTGGSTSTFIASSMSFKLASGSTPISLADTGAGTDALAITATQPFDDPGAGSDALTVAATGPPLTDTATGTDALALSGTAPPLTDSGAGTDVLAVNASQPLPETASASDALTIVALSQVPDSAAGTDALNVAAKSPPLTDAGAFSDALSVTVHVALSDSGAFADALAILGPTRDITLVQGPPVVLWHAGPAVSSSYVAGPVVTPWAAGPATQ